MGSRRFISFPNEGGSTGSTYQVNLFYESYIEQCKRLNVTPTIRVKPEKLQNILEINADVIKSEEWVPIFKALQMDSSLHVISIKSNSRYEFLEEVNSEEKLCLLRRRYGAIYTTYILKMLVQSISICLKRNKSLISLTFEGIPVSFDYIIPIYKSLKVNKSLSILNLTDCPLKDQGCQVLCRTLRNVLNIEILNLSACRIGTPGAAAIADLMKYQHNFINGLQRITLNENPLIGNEGLNYILNQLFDEFAIKTLDMQRCGITELMAHRILFTIEYSPTLELADFRKNIGLSYQTLGIILDILNSKQPLVCNGNLKWSTLNENSSECGPLKDNILIPVSRTCTCPLHKLRTCHANTALSKKSNATGQRKKLQESEIAKRIQKYLESIPPLKPKMSKFHQRPSGNVLKNRLLNNKYVSHFQAQLNKLLPTLVEEEEEANQTEETTSRENFQVDGNDF